MVCWCPDSTSATRRPRCLRSEDEWSSACRPDAARESRERGEDEEEEQEDGGEEGGGDEVEEEPLAGVAFEGGEAQVAHFCDCGGFSRSGHGDVRIDVYDKEV
ncbi:hypothetical protein RHMOL_Rhmol08G0137700 [Rhododendron molle]|uniref:Uncharacterized protein n=1 Tax=Rhododendron molle TaxID=49168 RepID=A0ACC0MPD0_RHOML|nr:hypothetical protein RHMOL_Rhmol08G0137700 [Rhododendron molle]